LSGAKAPRSHRRAEKIGYTVKTVQEYH